MYSCTGNIAGRSIGLWQRVFKSYRFGSTRMGKSRIDLGRCCLGAQWTPGNFLLVDLSGLVFCWLIFLVGWSNFLLVDPRFRDWRPSGHLSTSQYFTATQIPCGGLPKLDCLELVRKPKDLKVWWSFFQFKKMWMLANSIFRHHFQWSNMIQRNPTWACWDSAASWFSPGPHSLRIPHGRQVVFLYSKPFKRWTKWISSGWWWLEHDFYFSIYWE